jgi:hypothetical protein
MGGSACQEKGFGIEFTDHGLPGLIKGYKMSLVVFFCIMLAALIYLALPILRQPYWPCRAETPLADIRKEKRRGIWAIADVDSEFEMGRLTENDHATLRTQLKNELLQTMNREKSLLESPGRIPGKDIDLDLKNKLMLEVSRICGLKRS